MGEGGGDSRADVGHGVARGVYMASTVPQTTDVKFLTEEERMEREYV